MSTNINVFAAEDIEIIRSKSDHTPSHFQMVEEFIGMCGLSVDNLEGLDIKELNGWLEDELGSFQQGYEEYLDGKH